MATMRSSSNAPSPNPASKSPFSPLRSLRDRILLQEDLNFLLTNRIPRRLATQWMGWFANIRNPRLTRFSIAVWRAFTDLDLSEAKQSRFHSLHECFTRELRPGARRIDPDPSVCISPCDGIVGTCGAVQGNQVYQAKGFPYTLEDLFGNKTDAAPYTNGVYVTLRLTSSMYHRFHAPTHARITQVTYISGDTWNVNPIALKRIERLFCKNERAAIRLELPSGQPISLIAVAAILVASIRLHCVDVLLHPRWTGPKQMPCNVGVHKAEELGWFEHGSTVLIFAPRGFQILPTIRTGARVRMGEPLLQFPP